MINTFEEMLSGGHPNSLGNTIEVVDIILKDRNKLEDLYECYSSEDEVVRLRVSSAMKRVCKQQPEWLVPYIDRFITEISKIQQASTQWTFAQLMMILDDKLTETQRKEAIKVMKQNLETSGDWIVLNFTMETLSLHAHNDRTLKAWLLPHLHTFSQDKRKSVSKRAHRFLSELA